jgi:hypothetical protein
MKVKFMKKKLINKVQFRKRINRFQKLNIKNKKILIKIIYLIQSLVEK